MTGSDRRGDAPMGPPWPVDVLADLHAGVHEDVAGLLPRARQDPDAAAVLDALDATRAELSGLGQRPAPPMPAHLAARLDAAIAAEARAMFPAPRRPMQPGPAPLPPPTPLPPPSPLAPVVDLAAARRRRTRVVGWGVGALVAAAAVAVAVIAIPKGSPSLSGVAAPGGNGATATTAPAGQATGPEDLSSGQLPGAYTTALGRTDYGPLADPTRRAACLRANGQDPNRTPAGAMQVVMDGKPGIMLVLTTGVTAQFRVLVVGAACSADNPDTLANTVVGGVPPTTH